MKVKKYVGETIQDTIFKVKADLGSDAIILDTRKIKHGGFMGFFTKSKVEVLAALEDNRETQKTLKEINDLKKMLNNLHNTWQNKSSKQADQLPEHLTPVYNLLKKQGIAEELNQQIINEIKEQEIKNKKEIINYLQNKFKEIIGTNQPIKLNKKRKTVLFAGPTGIGKTTTIAKLAADFTLKKNKKVGLMTADTYRIAAVEQLQTYSDIVNIPLKILYNNREMKKIIKEDFKDFDLVLIDTAGSSWNDQIQLGRLKEICNQDFIDEKQLLISLNTKTDDLKEIINKFSIINPDRLLITKIDETTVFGDIINIKNNFDIPFSYITDGQDVPDDIKKASPDLLINYILGDLYE